MGRPPRACVKSKKGRGTPAAAAEPEVPHPTACRGLPVAARGGPSAMHPLPFFALFPHRVPEAGAQWSRRRGGKNPCMASPSSPCPFAPHQSARLSCPGHAQEHSLCAKLLGGRAIRGLRHIGLGRQPRLLTFCPACRAPSPRGPLRWNEPPSCPRRAPRRPRRRSAACLRQGRGRIAPTRRPSS